MKFKSTTQKRKKRFPVGAIIAIGICVVIIAAAGLAVMIVRNETSGARAAASGEVIVDVPEGAGSAEIGQLLEEYGLIGSADIFKLYLKVQKPEGAFQLGSHKFTGGMSYQEIVTELQNTTYKEVESFTITFPEGTTAMKMGMLLEEKGFCTMTEFVETCNNGTFTGAMMQYISEDPMKFVKLEGFLYPDTYEVEVGSTIEELIQRMLNNFEHKVMTPEIMAQIEKSEFTFEEIIILASMIQKESTAEFKYRVSGVFYHRMEAGSGFDKFESCTTDNFRWYVLRPYYGSEEQVPAGMEDAYNTYKFGWFPIGAICNPGADMVDAALNPEDTPYYFFCSNTETQEFFWAETDTEHEANKVLAGLK